MKKKIRKIVVGGEDYYWKVCPSGEFTGIKIWKGKKIYLQEYMSIVPESITPAFIAYKIVHPGPSLF